MNEFPFLSFSLLSVLEDQLGSDFPWIPPHPSPPGIGNILTATTWVNLWNDHIHLKRLHRFLAWRIC